MVQFANQRTTFKRLGFSLFITMLSLVVLSGCAASQDKTVTSVKVAQAGNQTVDQAMEEDADVVASTEVNVVLKAGGDVKQIVKNKGEFVKQGDLIMQLDDSDALRAKEKAVLALRNLQSQLDKTESDIAANKRTIQNSMEKLQLQIKELQKNYSSIHNDYDQGLATKKQLENADTQLSSAKLDLNSLQIQLDNLNSTDPSAPLRLQVDTARVSLQDMESTLSDYQVKAPIDGILTDFELKVGMNLHAGQAAGTIQQLNPIKIQANLTRDEANLVRGQTEIPFKLSDGSAAKKARVSFLSDVMSPQNQTYALELSVENSDQKLKPGMKVKLILGAGQKQTVLTVPKSSIVIEGNNSYVFVVSNSAAEKRKVVLGKDLGINRIVISGVKDGEQIVVSGQNRLKDREKVQISN
ncbi:efflux RND transporter periplasmic adaptor subunit [Ferviditalea candida]|uniref:Efflux RND transporter periplasmic adaptor subunit n=1 Tax=Ferviditalea candida TaxID=3108399 RepID=A0ABU5ZIM6_9BACL|nr:efflux RND transporter periplasmic adaptor subunit [Paenibacillaceae bacterium T2]